MRPFKIPTIVGRPPKPKAEIENERPAKRQRLSPELAASAGPTAKVASLPKTAGSQPQRPPLQPISVSQVSPPVRTKSAGTSSVYYNALWRRPTTKKNKTWDGDGIVTVSNGLITLEDASGKILGKTACKSELSAGSQLMLAGREVELDSVALEKDVIVSRKYFGKVQPKAPTRSAGTALPLSQSRPSSTTNASTTAAGFKMPLATHKESSVRDGKTPTPRHDPTAEGALVMRRPRTAPRGKHLVDVVVDPILTKELRDHQRAGVAFLYECVMGMKDYTGEGAVLADEMGLGKTLQTIALIWTLLKQNPIFEEQPVIRKALIVCPVTLINNWRKEFRKWLGNERIGVLVADGNTRITDFTHGKVYNVMIIGYERLRSVKEELQKGEGIDLVVADEGHRLKTAKNKSADAIKSLSTDRRIILSGTPIQNDLEEFYTMVDFVNPNLLSKYSVFKREFELPILKSQQPGATKKELEKGEARSEELASITGMFILRRTADILSKYLPSKTEYVVFCKPTSAQTVAYKSIIKSPLFSAALGSSALALELINVLKKVCNSPSLLLSKGKKNEDVTRSELLECMPSSLLKSPSSSGKLQVLDSLLHKIRTTTNEKVVLVSNYTSTLDILGRLLASLEYGYLRLDGSTPASKRQELVDRFNRSSANNFFVFLLSAKAGGVGLNLIGASRLILFDIDWNPATDLQAMARVHRDGQKKACYIYRLITKGALDEKIFQRQVSKTGLADSVVDGKSSASSFTKDELRDLFTLDESDGCQTHKLLGCQCDGDGLPPTLARQSADAIVRDEDGVEVVDFERTPPLIASSITSSFVPGSQVNMEVQEQEFRHSSLKDSSGRAKMLSLMQYSHLHTEKYKRRKEVVQVDAVEEQVDSLEANIVDDALGDSALQSVLDEDGDRVSFVFVKKYT